MTATGRTGRPDGLDHIGYVYDSAAGLAAGILPWVHAALRAGGQVSAIVERREARALYEALEPAAPIIFPSPAEVQRPSSAFLEHLREIGASPHGLIVAQYSAFDMPDGELRRSEDEINQTLADLPVTVICACSAAERPTRLITTRATHPRLLCDGVARDNEAHRRDGTPLEVGTGTHVLGLTFHGHPDLRHIRGRVAAVARSAGLPRDEAQASVMAVHEAALIVTAGRSPADRAGHEPCELDMWASDGMVTAELRGPRPAAPPTVAAAGQLPRDPVRRPEPLDYVRLFCSDATSVDNDGTRTVRLVVTRPH